MSISSVIQNLLLGAVFAILILLLFLKSFRATLVIGLSIPIAVISTFTLMYFTGETVNILTMGGLALGIGMMVDSAIVILEHIVTYRERGYSMKEAARLGATEIAPAVIASTTTTLVVFLPTFSSRALHPKYSRHSLNRSVCVDCVLDRIDYINSDAVIETFDKSDARQWQTILVRPVLG